MRVCSAPCGAARRRGGRRWAAPRRASAHSEDAGACLRGGCWRMASSRAVAALRCPGVCGPGGSPGSAGAEERCRCGCWVPSGVRWAGCGWWAGCSWAVSAVWAAVAGARGGSGRRSPCFMHKRCYASFWGCLATHGRFLLRVGSDLSSGRVRGLRSAPGLLVPLSPPVLSNTSPILLAAVALSNTCAMRPLPRRPLPGGTQATDPITLREQEVLLPRLRAVRARKPCSPWPFPEWVVGAPASL